MRPSLRMIYEVVLQKAQENNSFAKNIRRRQLEADYEVAAAKGNGCQYVSANCPDNVPVSYGFAGKKSFSEQADRRGYSGSPDK